MAAVAVTGPPRALVKRPSIKKYKAPTPPAPLATSRSREELGSTDASDAPSAPGTPDLGRTRSGSSASSAPASVAGSASSAPCSASSSPGSVRSRAAMFEASPLRNTDPALMSMRDRKALFERNKGAAIVPKAAFGMAAPLKALQPANTANTAADKVLLKKTATSKPRIEPKPELAGTHSPQTSRVAGALASLLGARSPQGQRDIALSARTQRDQEMKLLNNRFHKEEVTDLDAISPDFTTEDQEEENSPLMGNHGSASSLARALRRPLPPPPPCPPPKEEIDGVVGLQPSKRRSSTDSPQVVSVLEEVKRIRVTAPRAGALYPCLSDIEAPPSEPSCPASSLDTSSESAEPASEEWGNTSFGRDLLQVVGASAKKAQALPVYSPDSSDCSSLDGVLDDLDDEDTEGPTPPKINKNTAVSKSFNYKKGCELADDRFKSPLKTPPKSVALKTEPAKPLVHTVSFYRRQQSQTSTPSTPVRVVRHEGEQQNVEQEAQNTRSTAQDARRRVKELLEEVAKQNTVISQASQALNLCASTIEFSGSTEQAEGERLLLLATHRRQAFLHEVQRVQVEGVASSCGQRTSLTIQELCLPLRRDYVRQLNADGAVGHYLVCLVKCQERVVATSMARTAPDSFSVSFPDKINLQGLDSDFKVTVEVYALQASKEVLPHDIKYHIATKKSGKLATPRKGARGADLRAPPPSSPAGPAAVRAPALQPHGYCIFSHSQLQRNSFSLSKGSVGGPLEGSLRLVLQASRCASLVAPPTRRGFLTMLEEAGGFGAWHRRWCVLRAPDLSYWRYPDDENKKPPMGSIELATAITDTVAAAPRDLCARPHTLLLEVRGAPAEPCTPGELSLATAAGRRHLLAADTREEREAWGQALTQAVQHAKESD